MKQKKQSFDRVIASATTLGTHDESFTRGRTRAGRGQGYCPMPAGCSTRTTRRVTERERADASDRQILGAVTAGSRRSEIRTREFVSARSASSLRAVERGGTGTHRTSHQDSSSTVAFGVWTRCAVLCPWPAAICHQLIGGAGSRIQQQTTRAWNPRPRRRLSTGACDVRPSQIH